MFQPADQDVQQLLSFDALLNQFKTVLGPTVDTSTVDHSQTDDQLFQQINQLREWRETQQQKLFDNQLTERQLLNLEKEKLYELLGLSLTSEQIDSEDDDENYCTEDDGESGTEALFHVNEVADIDKEEAETPRTQIEMPVKPKSPPLPKPKRPAAVNEYASATETNRTVPKRPFLKRGEGLTNRFKVSPNAFRLDNLPRYKYARRVAQALSSKRQTANQQQQQQRDGARGEGQLSSSRGNNNNNIESSISTDKTPDVRKRNINNTNSSSGKLIKNGPTQLKLKPRKLANGSDSVNADGFDYDNSKILPSNDATSNPVQQVIPTAAAYPSTTPLFDTPIRNKVHRQHNEINELNIFEFLERRFAHSLVGSTPIQHKSSLEIASGTMAASDAKSNDAGKCFRTASIRPARCAVSQRSGDPRIIEMSADQDLASSYSSEDEEPRHVHFASHAVKYMAPDATTPIPDETCSILNESIADDTGVNAIEYTMDGSATAHDVPSTESFQRFKEKLFNKKLNQEFRPQLSVAGSVELDREVDDDTKVAYQAVNFQPNVSQIQLDAALAANFQAKNELLQTRLADLEIEIASFKEQNSELTKLIREHEVIRQEFEEERQTVQEQLNDERIKIEVYLHDENMKLVNERKELDRRVKEIQRPNRSERDEIVKLREQCANHEKELSARDQKHVAAQARIRAQLRNIEKEHKEMQFEVENLRRENKKLETENTRLRRQGNNKMLQEINRNIAKLAPQGMNGLGSQNALNNNNNDEQQRSTEARRPSRGIKNKGAKECSNRSAHRTVVAKVTSSRSGTPSGSQRMRSKSVPNLQAHDDDSISDYEIQNVSDSDSPDAMNGHTKSSYFRSSSETRARRSYSRESLTDHHKSPSIVANHNQSSGSNKSANYKRVIENPDGSKDVWYPNGNLKKISSDAMCIRMLYYNKDIKETNITEGTVKYYYAESNTWHTTYIDGLEILEFPNGQTEHRFKDGTIEIHFPNGSVRITNPYKEQNEGIREEWKYPDGTTVIQKTNGDKLLLLTNGQREVHTNGHKRREYPDGTVKIVYPDGSTESRYSNGRVRLKDKDGKLVMDSETIFV